MVEGVGKVYFELPDDLDVRSGLEFKDPPAEHDGQPITDASVGTIGRLYIDTLTRIVGEFRQRYSYLA
jgi:hypothetical protein